MIATCSVMNTFVMYNYVRCPLAPYFGLKLNHHDAADLIVWCEELLLLDHNLLYLFKVICGLQTLTSCKVPFWVNDFPLLSLAHVTWQKLALIQDNTKALHKWRTRSMWTIGNMPEKLTRVYTITPHNLTWQSECNYRSSLGKVIYVIFVPLCLCFPYRATPRRFQGRDGIYSHPLQEVTPSTTGC